MRLKFAFWAYFLFTSRITNRIPIVTKVATTTTTAHNGTASENTKSLWRSNMLRSSAQEFSHSFSPGADLQFFVNPADVGVDGFVTDTELFGDFLVEKALGKAIQHLLFAWRQILGLLGGTSRPLE